VILLYPALLVAAVAVARRSERAGRGPSWFAGWALAGALFLFSLATGFSIGLFVLPLVAVVLLWVASRAPRWREACGFLAGCVAMVAFFVALNA
jgi:uncharacterized membrane protein